jgi:hypothetical protein
MNYYEELGLTPEATPEEIHQAHRKLTKLLHPDQQTDESLRRLAEAQMRRLNSIVDVLSDSDSRRQYNKGVNATSERVHAPTHAQNNGILAMPNGMGRSDVHQILTSIRRRLPWWVWSTAGALILTCAAVWFFADNLGSSFGNKTMAYVPVQDPPSQSASGASINPLLPARPGGPRAETRLQELTARLRGVFNTKPGQSQPAGPQATQADTQPSEKEVVAASQQAAVEQVNQPPPPAVPSPKTGSSNGEPARNAEAALARLTPPKVETTGANTAPQPVMQTPALPKPTPPPQPSASPAVTSQNAPAVLTASGGKVADEQTPIPDARSAVEGDWIYAPKKPERAKPGLYPPDFIEMRLFRSQGALRGTYHARYQVDGTRLISPEVTFQLSSQAENSRMLSWEGDNGSRGWLKLNPVDKSTIKVQWQTTVYSKQPSLTAGVATLVRR